MGGDRVCWMAVGFSPPSSPGVRWATPSASDAEAVYAGALAEPPSTWDCDGGGPTVASFGIP